MCNNFEQFDTQKHLFSTSVKSLKILKAVNKRRQENNGNIKSTKILYGHLKSINVLPGRNKSSIKRD